MVITDIKMCHCQLIHTELVIETRKNVPATETDKDSTGGIWPMCQNLQDDTNVQVILIKLRVNL